MTQPRAVTIPAVPLDPEAVRASADRVLAIEAEAIHRLARELPQDFVPAVAAILACQGRVILAGIGKSGHIARKIAATLSSTGSPAMFVHPAEASHGDLGMVTEGDICILISNSGETAELNDLITHTRRFGIPLIGISRKLDSTLMRAADLCLTLPDAPEACAIGMAPTTSTTLTLALGDALAVALMEQRGFLPEDFRAIHPGGKLGARLALVRQLMQSGEELPLVGEAEPMPEVIIAMSARGHGLAIVVDGEGRLSGVISDGDIRRNIDGLMERSALQVATRDPLTIAADLLAAEAVAVMNRRKVTSMIVVDEMRRPVGLLKLHDCLKAGVI